MPFLRWAGWFTAAKAMWKFTYGPNETAAIRLYGVFGGAAASVLTYDYLLRSDKSRTPLLRRMWEGAWSGPSTPGGSTVFRLGPMAISDDLGFAVVTGTVIPVAAAYALVAVGRRLRPSGVIQDWFNNGFRKLLLAQLLLPCTATGSVLGAAGYRLAL